MTMLPKSSTFFEDMIFMPFVFKDNDNTANKFEMVENVYNSFSNPLNIQIECDTDPRVPAKFVLGERLKGRIKETEEKPWPLSLDQEFTRFRQSPTFLSEIHFKKKAGKYYYI
jgi:hypothetical protein